MKFLFLLIWNLLRIVQSFTHTWYKYNPKNQNSYNTMNVTKFIFYCQFWGTTLGELNMSKDKFWIWVVRVQKCFQGNFTHWIFQTPLSHFCGHIILFFSMHKCTSFVYALNLIVSISVIASRTQLVNQTPSHEIYNYDDPLR